MVTVFFFLFLKKIWCLNKFGEHWTTQNQSGFFTKGSWEFFSKRGIYYVMLLNLFDQRTFDQTSITYNTLWEMCSKLIGANMIVRTDLLEPYQLNP